MKQLLILIILMAASAQAIEPAAFDDPAVEQRYRSLLAEIRCVVCQNQTLADSNAQLAMDLRAQVQTQIEAGRTDREVLAYLTDRYGDFVLYRPPFNAITAALWFSPLILLLFGVGIWWSVLSSGGGRSTPEVGALDLARVRDLLDKEDEHR